MQPVTVNGTKLEYELMGEGAELVLLHGLGGNLELERRNATALAQTHRVLWYSSRGHGRSAPAIRRTGWSYAAMAGDLDAMIDVAGFARPILVGGSHGANTILRHAVEHPGRAAALFLIAPGGNCLDRPSRARLAPIWLMLQLARLRGSDGLIRFITGLHPDNPNLDPQVLAAARTHDSKALFRALRYVPDQRAVEEKMLASLNVPTVVAAWDNDPVIHPIALARHLAEVIPGAQFEEIEQLVSSTPEQIATVLAGCVGRWANSLH